SLSCRAQAPGLGIHPEHDDAVGILVLSEKPLTGGIQGEMTRGLAASRLALDQAEPPGFWIHGKSRNRVVAAVRTIDKSSRGMDLNFGTGVVAFEVFRERGNSLQLFE